MAFLWILEVACMPMRKHVTKIAKITTMTLRFTIDFLKFINILVRLINQINLLISKTGTIRFS